MKKILFALTTVAIMASCSNDNPTTAAETKIITPTDTAGLAQFQAWKMQNELAATQQAQQNLVAEQPVKEVVKERVVYVNKPAPRRKASTARSSTSSSSGNSGSSSGSSSSTSQNTAKKEGWSKAAKGAVIGGVGGAVIGGVVNKRNRGAGAVIGGVLGAGAGYGIGRSKDKKDGRY
jgi:hypothetical protein